MVFTNITPFPFQMGAVGNIAPLTHRDASGFLNQLETIKNWLNEVMVPDSNEMIANAIEEFQTGIANAEATVTAAKAGWQGEWDEWTADKAAEYSAFVADITGQFTTFKDTVNAALAANLADITAEKLEWQASWDSFIANVELELAALSDSAMGGLIGTPTSETAIALAKMTHKEINVKKHGAKGDGVTDDRAAFQAAIDEALALPNGGTIVVDNGNYMIGTPGIVVPHHTKNLILKGAGMGGTGRYGTVLTRTGDFPVITAKGIETAPAAGNKQTSGVNLYDLTIQGNNKNTAAVRFSHVSGYVWERVRIAYSKDEAFHGTQLWNVRHLECLFETSGDLARDVPAVRLDGSLYEGTNTVHMLACHFEGNLGDDVLLNGNINNYPTVGVLIDAAKFERSAGAAVRFRGAQANSITNSYLYSNTSGSIAVFESGAIRNTLSGNVMAGNANTPFLIQFLGGKHNSLVGNTMYWGTTAAIRIGVDYAPLAGASHGDYITIIGNTWENGPSGAHLLDERTHKKGTIFTPESFRVGVGSGNAAFTLDGAPNGNNGFSIHSGGLGRWTMRKNADSGGGNLEFIGVKDDATTSTPLVLNRQTGVVSIGDLQATTHLKHTNAGGTIGFYGASAVSRRTVLGSRGGNAAVAALLVILAENGLIIDGTTA